MCLKLNSLFAKNNIAYLSFSLNKDLTLAQRTNKNITEYSVPYKTKGITSFPYLNLLLVQYFIPFYKWANWKPFKMLLTQILLLAQSAGAAEYTNYDSVGGQDSPLHTTSSMDSTLNKERGSRYGALWRIPSLLLLPGLL